MEIYENEIIEPKDLKTFMYCGNNIPTECICGCGLTRLFSFEEQEANFQKKDKYRFFQNEIHIRRFRILRNL
jgi:hypothetical protein